MKIICRRAVTLARKFLIGALIVLLSASIFSAASAKKSDGAWRLDGNAMDGLRNFRLMTDDWLNDSRGREPSCFGERATFHNRFDRALRKNS